MASNAHATLYHFNYTAYVIAGIMITIIGLGIFLPRNALFSLLHRAASGSGDTVDLTKGQWGYLPGASVEKDGVHITHLGQAIVQQDGSGGQANPPVNLYGTRLDARGDIVIKATIHNRHGPASLQLYGGVPIIQDEFRVEQSSVRLTINDSTITAKLWHGTDIKNQDDPNLSAQTPATTATYQFTSTDSDTISITRDKRTLSFSANGKPLGSISDKGVWNTGQIWFGADADATQGSWTLAGLEATAGRGGSVAAVDTSAGQPAAQAQMPNDGLQKLAAAKRPGFVVGAAMALAPASSDPDYARVAFDSENFGALTTENALKWQFIEPQPGTYDFHAADALVDLAQKHNMAIHGHTLVFGEANPGWVTALPTTTESEKTAVKAAMTSHITQTVRHFKDKIASWDVVNEPLADYDDTNPGQDGLRQHKWYQAMGENYIATAFRTAHAADPKAKLFMNEYGLEQDGERWDTFLKLVSTLKKQGVPIDGVGFQAHVYEAGDKIDPDVLRAHIKTLADLGLKSRISEMDVYDDDGADTQARQYTAVFKACLSEPGCVAWTTWGVSDRYDMFQDDDRTLQYGHDFLWDEQVQPTEAQKALAASLR